MLKESVTAALPADMVFILNRVESGVRSISAFVKLDLMQGCQIEKYCCWFADFVHLSLSLSNLFNCIMWGKGEK